MKRKRRERERDEGKHGGGYRSTIIRNFTSVGYRFTTLLPSPFGITFSSRIVDHVRSKCSLKRIIYTSGRNARVERTIKETKRRDESDLLLSNVALHFSLTKRPDPSDIAQFLFSRNIPREYI